MYISIDLEAYYDWAPSDSLPTKEDVLALQAKPAQDGKWLKKIIIQQPTHTDINLPESEIQSCLAHFERIGAPKTRQRLIAWYLEEKVMPHHAHTNHFVKVNVHDEPEIEAFLNTYFETQTEAAPRQSTTQEVAIPAQQVAPELDQPTQEKKG